jgi:hypothetical protein
MLVLFRFMEMKPLAGVTSLVDWRLLGHLSKLMIDGFFSGECGETLLMPMGHRLAHKHLLLFGLGERSGFGREGFERGVSQMFDTARRLDRRDLVMALPGRAENHCSAVDAVQWFLSCYESEGGDQGIFIVEPADAQKAMAPVIERWRLKRLVP